jgi:putative sporulation protein YtxC
MMLFTVSIPVYMRAETGKLEQRLMDKASAFLHKHEDEWGEALVRYERTDDMQIVCSAEIPQFRLKEHGPSLYEAAADAIADFIIAEMEYAILASIIRRKCRNHTAADLAAIERYCYDMINGKEWEGLGSKFLDADRRRRQNKIAADTEQFLQEHTDVHLGGLTTFRLHAYRQELAEIVDYALDEYVLDKQYQEFISLLKYFVFLQDTKTPMVHLLHKGGHEFMLLDERFEPLDHAPPSDRIVAEMLETEMNIEDMVVSSLISVSPEKITIHTRQADTQVIRTIETIFDQRVTICEHCAGCNPNLDELVQP